MIDSGSPTFEFGPFRVDAQRRILERDGQPVALSGKAFEILLVLLRHPGELVEKEVLMREVWPDTAVEDNNLTVNISGLRKSLGETVGSPRIIITVPGRGYRFAGEVRSPAPQNAPEVAMMPAAKPRPARLKLTIGMVTLLAGIAIAGFWMKSKPASSIAVLPFRVLNQDARNEYLGMGLADALITRLGNLHEFVVRPLASVTRLAGKDPLQAGAELSVDSVLEGSVQTGEDRIRVSVRLLRVKDRVPLWAGNFDEPVENPFALEDSISLRVANSLLTHLSGVQQQALAKRYTTNSAAYGNYLRGRYFALKYTEDGFRKSLGYLQNAIDADPAYALAYSGLADTYYDASNLILPPVEAMPKAKAAAQKAVALDPSLAEAHVSLGVIASKYDWDWGVAEKEFQTALSLDPNSPTVHQWLGLYRAQLGDTTRAVTELRRAQELDPLSNDINSYLSTTLYWARRYDEALQQGRKVIEFDPTFIPGYVTSCWTLAAQGHMQEALADCEKAHMREASPWTILVLARVQALAGNRAAAQHAVEEMKSQSSQFVSGYDLAVVYAALGKPDEAFLALDDAYHRRAEWLGYLKIDPQVDALRSDPRFRELQRKMGL